ncbi:MAG: PASTA domain-containing protein [Brevinema sp.]
MKQFSTLIRKLTQRSTWKTFFIRIKDLIKKWTQLSTWQELLLPENPQEHRRMVRFLIATFLLMVLAVIFAFIIAFFILKSGQPKARIPNVEQQNILDAVNILQSENFKIKFETQFDTRHEIYTVIKQQPKGGVITREGREITLTVSLGRDLYKVPKICGLTKTEALELLKSKEIPFTIQTVPAGTNTTAQVLALNITPGRMVDRNQSLIVTIAEAQRKNHFEMENFLYQPIEYVVATLYNYNINPIIISSNITSRDDEGLVLEQNIKEGEIIAKNSSVIISVGLNARDEGEKEKLRWYAINFYIPSAESSGELQIITNVSTGEVNEIITPTAPTAKFYKAVLSDELGRENVIYEKQGAEGSSFVRIFKAYGRAKVTIFADNEIIAERFYGSN